MIAVPSLSASEPQYDAHGLLTHFRGLSKEEHRTAAHCLAMECPCPDCARRALFFDQVWEAVQMTEVGPGMCELECDALTALHMFCGYILMRRDNGPPS